MSYLDYFCLDYNPFNEQNWVFDAYESKYLKQVKSRIKYVAKTQNFCLITGKSSSGVTRSIYESIKELDKNIYKIFYISAGNYKTYDFYNVIANELELYITGYSKSSVKSSIQKAIANIIYKEEQKPVFVIDNAHLLEKEALFELSVFYDFGLESGLNTCLVLAGNDILRNKIRNLHLNSFADRIATNYKLKYLNQNEIKNYIKSQMPDNNYPLQFYEEKYLLQEITNVTQGNYRKINMLMTNLMILSAQKKLTYLTVEDVKKAKNEIFFC